MKRTASFLVTLALCSIPLHAQQEPDPGEELREIRQVLDAQNESAREYRGYVDALRKIRISGYLQPQFRLTSVDNVPWDIGTVSGGTFPKNVKNLFNLRRARVKVNYDNVLTQLVVQVDIGQTSVGIKDAYLSLTDPWLQSFALTMGVFDRPFGHEISFSSGTRESPERSRVFQTLFPGERELGVKVTVAPPLGPLNVLRADLGVFNGAGPTAQEFDNFKDVIGRIGAQFPFEEGAAALDVGVSGYFGRVRSGSSEVFRSGTLADGNRGLVPERDTTNAGKGFDRHYVGIDARFYYDVPVLGGLILRGEYLLGRQPGLASTSVSSSTQATAPLYLRDFAGWYVSLVQSFGRANQLVVKYDVYDPNTDVAAGEIIAGSGHSAADLRFSTLGFGGIHHWDNNIKFVLYYEIVRNETVSAANVPSGALALYRDDLRDNVMTFRIQYKF